MMRTLDLLITETWIPSGCSPNGYEFCSCSPLTIITHCTGHMSRICTYVRKLWSVFLLLNYHVLCLYILLQNEKHQKLIHCKRRYYPYTLAYPNSLKPHLTLSTRDALHKERRRRYLLSAVSSRLRLMLYYTSERTFYVPYSATYTQGRLSLETVP